MTASDRFNALKASLTTNGKLIHVQAILERAAGLWPKNKIVLCMKEQLTYKELYFRAVHLAHALRSMGVTKSERVIIFYENSIEFYIAYFAVWQAGGIVVPLNVFLSEHELIKIVEDSQPKVLIISPQLKEKLSSIPPHWPPIITHIDKTSTLPRSVVTPPRDDEDIYAVAALLYTSGTTGFPKGVMLSSFNIISNALQGISVFEFDSKERVFCALPLFHSYPQNICMWSTVLLGATAIIVPKIERKTIIRGVKQKPTIVVAVPALYGLFCLLRSLTFKRVRYFVSGGDALSDKIRSYFSLLYRRKIVNGYGLTETTPFVAADIEDYTKPTSTIGKPLIGINVEIRNETGEKLPQGTIGTLWVKGDNIMMGYYNAPKATEAILQNGWLNTGDLAYLDDQGDIVLAGRERDLISNKGLKIYPQEIENVLLSHPAVLQAAVIGVKDGGEEIPVAFVASKETDTEKLIHELRHLCERNLAAYKVPRQFYVMKELPVTATGKVDKKVLEVPQSQGNP